MTRAVWIVLLLFAMGMTKIYAYDFSAVCSTGQTLYYNIIDSENHYVELTCPGTPWNGEAAYNGFTRPTGNISLPANVSYNGISYSVTAIGPYAFYLCTGLTGTLNIRSAVNSIGVCAFTGCSFTGELIIPDNVTTIGSSAFSSNGITMLNVGNGVENIGSSAFSGCQNLAELTIGEGVTYISGNAFWNCPQLTTVHFNAINCTEMANWVDTYDEDDWENVHPVFSSSYNWVVPNITTVTIGENVQIIPGFAFKDCSNIIGELTIPNSVTIIGGAPFYNCTGLTSLTLGSSLNSIYSWAFRNCSGVSSITILDNTPAALYSDAFLGINNGIPIYVPCGKASVYASSSFWDWRQFTNYQEQNMSSLSVTSNDEYLGTTEITQQATCSDDAIVTAISNAGAFLNWTENGEVVSTDNPYSFELTSDRNLVANFVMVEVVEGDFKYTLDLATGEASVKANNTSVTTSSFATSINYQGTDYLVTSIAKSGFSDCTNITEMIIPNSIVTIGSGAFARCRFTKVIIPSSVTTIGQQVFFNCIALKEVRFEDGDELITLGNNKYSDGIGGGLFENCPVEIAYIGRNIAVSNYHDSYNRPWTNAPFSRWWYNDYAPLSEVIIGNGVTKLCDYFFNKCNAVASIVSCVQHPGAMNLGTEVFNQVPKSTCVLYVPENSTEEYQNTAQWSDFTNIQEMQMGIITFADANVKDICVNRWDTNGDGEINYTEAEAATVLGNAFKNNSTITTFNELQYFTRLTAIDDAFSGCSCLTSIVIPSSVTTIGNSAFYNCISLVQIMVDTGNSVFDSRDNCNAIIRTSTNALVKGCNSTIIPNSVTSIRENAFYNCIGLTSIEIPNSVTEICYDAFKNCSNLTSIEIPNSLNTISGSAFSGCIGLEQIMVDSENSVYDSRENCNAVIKTSTNSLVIGCKTTVIPNSIVSIGESAFRDCSGLTSIIIPNSVNLIGSSAFENCSGLSTLTIGNSVTNINSYAFKGCINMANITILAETPPNLNYYSFYNVNHSIPIFIPFGSLEAYQSAPYWNEFTNYQEIAYTTIPGYGSDNDKWAFIASPLVENAVPTTVDNMITETEYDLYRFNQSVNKEWLNYKAHTNDFIIINGQGYLYANSEDVNLIFKGEFNEDDTKTVSLVYDANAESAGWNLVGNPFPVSAYANKSYYTMNEDGSDIEPVAVSMETAIPACTGVMVKAENAGESVTFSKTAPETAVNQGVLQMAVAQNNTRGASTGSAATLDEAIVSFNAGDKLAKFFFNKDNAILYIPQGNDNYAIAYAEKQGEIPLNFEAKENGNYTISVNLESVEMNYLHLIDNMTGTDIDLLATPSYTFESKTNDYASRFRLVFFRHRKH